MGRDEEYKDKGKIAFGGKSGTRCAGPNQLSLGTCSGDEPKIEEAVFLILLYVA